MNRRHFLASSAGMAAAIATIHPSIARQGTPVASELPSLGMTLTDTSFELPATIQAGRYAFAAVNAGTSTASHYGIGRIPDRITDEDFLAWMDTGGESNALTFEEIEFVGAADWPQPGGPAATGVIDLHPGRYFVFDPFSGRKTLIVTVEGEFPAVAEPAADLKVTLHEMEIMLPESAFTSSPMRWKIENTGAVSHEVAVLPIPEDFTVEMFMTLLSLPEDATPPPGTPDFEYQPTRAIGILGPGKTSWLDVQLQPGHYLAACMLPFGTGYPHAMDGMFVIFDVA